MREGEEIVIANPTPVDKQTAEKVLFYVKPNSQNSHSMLYRKSKENLSSKLGIRSAKCKVLLILLAHSVGN